MSDSFFEEWRVYEKLLVNDYLDHRGFFERLSAEITGRFDRPVEILDLGCGDLKPVRDLLSSVPVARYVGVDESEPALSIARVWLKENSMTGDLIAADMREAFSKVSGPFDVIIASFSVHHISDRGEVHDIFAHCIPLLSDDGFVAMIDVFKRPAEDREIYLDRWIAHAEKFFLALDDREKQHLFDHVRAYDYPMSLAQFRKICSSAGLDQFDVLMEDAHDFNRLVVLST